MRIALGFFIILLLQACASNPPQSVRLQLSNPPSSFGATLHSMLLGSFALQYAETGEVGKPTVVFIHGTPGSWRSLGRLFEHEDLQAYTRMVAIDRPGWGGSPLPDRETEGDLQAQADLIAPLLEQLKQESGGKPLILVGHSLGASIAPIIAQRHPQLVDGLLMASGAIDPRLGKPRWYNYAANIWPISRLIDPRMVKANVEIWGVYDALKNLEPWWQSATIPMVYLQGENDELVSPRNLNFAESQLPEKYTKVVRIPKQGHFVHRQQQDLIADMVLQLTFQAESLAEQEAVRSAQIEDSEKR